jgi:hypothetical protein
MPTIMRALGFANGVDCPVAGQWVKTFDHEAHGGIGDGVFTANPAKAMRFASFTEAVEFWKKIPKCKPLREDGKPNRPLSATTVTFDEIDDLGNLTKPIDMSPTEKAVLDAISRRRP